MNYSLYSESVWIGYDPREVAAFAVARASFVRNLQDRRVMVRGLILDDLKASGMFYRSMERRNGNQWWDVISDAPCATEFSISRFLVPELARSGLAIFADCDMLALRPMGRVFEIAKANPKIAVWCVKHRHEPTNAMKMDNQMQTVYARKNWSSFMLFNCDHPSNKALTVELINSVPGRDLHRFCWLKDEEIGELGAEWNWLAGHSDESIEPIVVHHTDGSPNMPMCEGVPYAPEWQEELRMWAR